MAAMEWLESAYEKDVRGARLHRLATGANVLNPAGGNGVIGGSLASKYKVVIERDEDGYYVASVPGLPGCHTQAKTLDKLMGRIQEAIGLYLEDDQFEFSSSYTLLGSKAVGKHGKASAAQA
jgi:predicted RNase H-like HicB family nuclease